MRSKHDYGVYYRSKDDGRLIIRVYVDNLIITGSSSHRIIEFKEDMKGEFEITDLCALSSYLGIEIKQCNTTQQRHLLMYN